MQDQRETMTVTQDVREITATVNAGKTNLSNLTTISTHSVCHYDFISSMTR